MLYTRVNCGLRQVVETLNVLNDIFEGLLGIIPCYNTIENWMRKCGLHAYEKDSLIASTYTTDYITFP